MIKDALRKLLSAQFKVEINKIRIDYPQTKFGDYSTNLAFTLAKQQKKSPTQVAQAMVDKLGQAQMLAKVEAKAGFINFYLSGQCLASVIGQILKEKRNFGHSDFGADMKVLVEFISANPTGPLTLGNGRGGFFGDVLANVLKSQGYHVSREYYVNDTGTQIENLGKSILAIKLGKKLDEDLYQGEYVKQLAKKITGENAVQVGQAAAAIILEEYLRPSIDKMGVSFDHYFSEKSLQQQGAIEHTLGILDKAGLIYHHDGATWLKTTKLGESKDDVLIKSDGQYTYFVCDIAYHLNKMQRGFNILIDIWGADHAGHKPRIEKVLKILSSEIFWQGQIEILVNQLVRLVKNGQEEKMSKRSGTFVTLDQLIDKVGLDVTRFFFLSYVLSTHLDFDLNLAQERSAKNPVFYVQYAHARLCSILKKAQQQGLIKNLVLSEIEFSQAEELALAKKLVQYPEILADTAFDWQVQRLPFYCKQVADLFHSFYEQCHVLPSDKNPIEKKVINSRLALVLACKQVLENCLYLMGISAPDKM